MTTYLDQPDDDFPEQYEVVKPSHREEDLGMRNDDRFVDGHLEDEDSHIE